MCLGRHTSEGKFKLDPVSNRHNSTFLKNCSQLRDLCKFIFLINQLCFPSKVPLLPYTYYLCLMPPLHIINCTALENFCSFCRTGSWKKCLLTVKNLVHIQPFCGCTYTLPVGIIITKNGLNDYKSMSNSLSHCFVFIKSQLILVPICMIHDYFSAF